MLVLSRKAGERIMIGDNICVVVTAIQGRTIRLGFEAPTNVNIRRAELNHRSQPEQTLLAAVR